VQLGDMSNLTLTLLQQPNAAFVVGGGTPTGPTWQTNQQFSQGLVEFCINEGYKKLMGDIEGIELALVSFTLTSTQQTYKYAIPPSGYAIISHVARVFYQPKGLPYNREFRQGKELVSWAEYTRYTGQNYLLPYAFGTQPWIATVDPLRANVYFYPGSAIAGDTITVDYTPIPTNPISGVNATGCPIMVLPTDAPIIPSDCHMAIVYYALSLLWIRAREAATAGMYDKLYRDEVQKIINKYTKLTHGDTIRIEAFDDSLSLYRNGII